MNRPSKKYLVNRNMFLYGLGYGVFLLIIGFVLIPDRPYSALIFFLLSLPFLFIAIRYGSVVTVSEEGVEMTTFFRRKLFFRWEEVEEVTVIGSRVLNKGKTKKCGTLYLVFSRKTMTEQERFDMMIYWPPKDKIYMTFTKERLYELQWYYTKPVAKYNIGMLDI